jgi:hypothetical protein
MGRMVINIKYLQYPFNWRWEDNQDWKDLFIKRIYFLKI